MKELLSQYRLIGLRIQSRLERIAFFKGYPNTEEHCRRLYDEVKELKKTQEHIAGLIDSLSEPYKSVLRLRFIEGKTVEDTAEELHYSYRWLMRLQKMRLRCLSLDIFLLSSLSILLGGETMSLKQKRLCADLTQKELSALSGIGDIKISNIETGKIKPENIRLSTALKLAKALRCRPDELLEEVSDHAGV